MSILFTYDLKSPINIYLNGEVIEVKSIEVYEPTLGHLQSSQDCPIGILQEIEYGNLFNATREMIAKGDLGGESEIIAIQSLKNISEPQFGKQQARLTEAYLKIFFSKNTADVHDKQTLVKAKGLSLQAQEASNLAGIDFFNLKKKLNEYFAQFL